MKHAADGFLREITMRRGADGVFYVCDDMIPQFTVRAQNDDDLRIKLAPLLASCAGIEDFRVVSL